MSGEDTTGNVLVRTMGPPEYAARLIGCTPLIAVSVIEKLEFTGTFQSELAKTGSARFLFGVAIGLYPRARGRVMRIRLSVYGSVAMPTILVLLVICVACPTPAFIAFTAATIASYAIFKLAKWLCGAASRFLKAIKWPPARAVERLPPLHPAAVEERMSFPSPPAWPSRPLSLNGQRVLGEHFLPTRRA